MSFSIAILFVVFLIIFGSGDGLNPTYRRWIQEHEEAKKK